ncbi:MAG TPA: STAS domain-containing protein [Candidatus Baltobacteraceae bacterium]|jgi:anti-anti-sigma factor|nr:STAS domain-containing protein [Candidatus Baltobacteraceae bacterium]
MAPARIELYGEYDLSRRAEIQLTFATLVPNGALIVDLSKVTYVDSTFLNELVELRERLPGSQITLLGPNANLRRVLQLMSFDRLFDIRESEAV